MFVRHGSGAAEPIASMPGQFRYSVDRVISECESILSLKIPAIILFGIPETKDDCGSSAWDEDGVVATAVRRIKKHTPELVVIVDVCLCEYTSHGHCGLVEGEKILNDPTLELLGRTALCYAAAGADVVAPSDMMDGRVGAIRSALDDGGFADTVILSYAAKYHSAFYGPFREAVDSAPRFGDRATYQLDPANADEALREARLDVEEGADIIMVKPALPYLDVIRRLKTGLGAPTAAYCVSGEYAMIKAAVANGWLDERRAVLETLRCIRRAGADFVITYSAKDAARWLGETA